MLSFRNFLFLIYLLLFTISSPTLARKHRDLRISGRRLYRHIPQFPRRQIQSRMDCRAHERFVKCGPEPHCEMSCDNLFSPPHCHTDYNHPKCYYPRCICNTGYVRDKEGFCVREWKCPGRYFEFDDDDGNTEYQFRLHPRKQRVNSQLRRHFW